MALNEFEGTVMLVSHDRALLRAVCDEFWMVSRGGVSPFDGDLDDYQRYLLEEGKRLRELDKEREKELAKASAAATQAATPAPSAKTSNAPARTVASEPTRQLKKELQRTEQRIAEINAEIATLEAQLANQAPPTELAALGKQRKALAQELQDLEENWLELSTRLEA
jgi:ATP-binding cassette subfamily F protein 3